MDREVPPALGARFDELDKLVEEMKQKENAHGRKKDNAINPTKHDTTVKRKSERELVVTRTFNGRAHIVFDAWTKPELLKRWWVPKSFGISFLSCETDVRTGGTYRFVFSHPCSEQPMSFFGRYLEVIPPSRLVWTNDEGDEGGAVTTVTFEERRGGETLVVLHDLYPSKKALDDAIASGSTSGPGEQFEQLDKLLVSLVAGVGR